MKTYNDYIKEEINGNGVLEYWIEQPFFKPSDFKEAIEARYNLRFKFVAKNELSNENEIEFIKEELADLQVLIKPKPSYDYAKLSFAQRISGDCWFSDETIDEFKRYFKEYYDYKIIEFKVDYLKNKLKNLREPKTDNGVLKNEFSMIFKNDIGFTVFTKMFEHYRDDRNTLANFSFLFYAMEKDFLVCNQTEFREFLRGEKYNIEIEKIDSRQSGENNKTKLYSSIKERYQPNIIKAQ